MNLLILLVLCLLGLEIFQRQAIASFYQRHSRIFDNSWFLLGTVIIGTFLVFIVLSRLWPTP